MATGSCPFFLPGEKYEHCADCRDLWNTKTSFILISGSSLCDLL